MAEQSFPTPFNIVAAFPAVGEAQQAVDNLVQRGVPRRAVELNAVRDGKSSLEVAEQRSEMQDELSTSWPVTGMAIMTKTQTRGAEVGILLFTALGIVVGVAAGLVWSLFGGPPDLIARLIIAVVLSVGGFVTAGFIAGGGLAPRLRADADPERSMDDERTVAEKDALVGVHLDDRLLAEEAAAVLTCCGAERVHLVDAEGTPLPPQAKKPRPADPEGYWWDHAGSG